MTDEFTALTQDLPHLEVLVAGHPDGYRAIATFGDKLFVAIDDDPDAAAMLAQVGLEAILASLRD